jgi:hypothetical protein
LEIQNQVFYHHGISEDYRELDMQIKGRAASPIARQQFQKWMTVNPLQRE